MKFKILSLLIFIVAMIICGCSNETAQNSKTQASKTEEIQTNIEKVKQDSKAEEIQANVDKIRQDSGVAPKFSEVAAAKLNPVDEILNQMTLEEKIGQMMICGFHGTTANEDINFMLNNYHFGGIIFFDRNLESKAQVKALTADLNSLAAQKLPLFFAIDEEGGRVSRMAHALTPPPSQQEIGQTGDSSLAYSYANSIAQELKSMGINLNLAPVADVGTPDTRSFSDNGDVVAEFVSQAAKGYENAGIFFCLKHFPGIGLWQVDSHEDLSIISADRYTLETIDLLPFKKIISENDNSKFMIMVSHYIYTAFDAENSATISPAILTGLLRNELGFSGVVITDDLDMGAIAKYHDEKTLGAEAIQAGADIVLSCHDYEKQKQIYDGIFEAVKRGEISEERINNSVRRILTMKLELIDR